MPSDSLVAERGDLRLARQGAREGNGGGGQEGSEAGELLEELAPLHVRLVDDHACISRRLERGAIEDRPLGSD